MEYREKLINTYYDYTTGSFSLAMLFLSAGHNLLSPGGVFGYITQNNIFTSLAGENVRKYLANNNILHKRFYFFSLSVAFSTVSPILDLISSTAFCNKSRFIQALWLNRKPKA